MSTAFGVYMALVGVAVVFIMLLALAKSELLRRLFSGRAEAPEDGGRKRARVAAMAAVCRYIGLEENRFPRLRTAARPSRWSAVARMEALEIGRERFR